VSRTSLSAIDVNLRSYGQARESDRHEFTQLVLPMNGQVALQIDGKRGRVDPGVGAVIAPGLWHSQHSSVPNNSIILDVDSTTIGLEFWERLFDRPFMPIGPAARKLIEYMGLMTKQKSATPSVIHGWTPLLLDTLVLGTPQPSSRLTSLLVRVQADPGLPWSTESMAECASLSVSRLHAIFRFELQTSPHAWLLQQRINHACELLDFSGDSIAEIALAAGFSDQSALTRAMRDSIDTTPAAYRRHIRENRSKKQ